MVKKITKDEIMSILGVKIDRLKIIERKSELETRLNEKGYVLHSKTKEGRKVFYEIEQVNESKEILNNIIQFMYGTKQYKEFSEYFTIRTVFARTGWVGATPKKISDKTGVGEQTIRTWDDRLTGVDIISKDGFFYFSRHIDEETGEYVNQLISQEEYNSFWRNKGYANAMRKLQERYDNGEITFNELQVSISDASEILKIIKNKYCFRVSKFLLHGENITYLDTFDLIKNVYLTDIGLDYIQLKE